jgi:hypothetical protein
MKKIFIFFIFSQSVYIIFAYQMRMIHERHQVCIRINWIKLTGTQK